MIVAAVLQLGSLYEQCTSLSFSLEAQVISEAELLQRQARYNDSAQRPCYTMRAGKGELIDATQKVRNMLEHAWTV